MEDSESLNLTTWPRLRDSGTCLTQMISAASATPVCFSSLLTGHYSFNHGLRTFQGPRIEANIPTIASAMKTEGYTTHGFFTGPLIEEFGLSPGFDYYEHRPVPQYVYSDWGSHLLQKFDEIAKTDPWLAIVHLFEVHMPRQLNNQPDPNDSLKRYKLAWEQLDSWLKKLLEKLPENTLVILTADHGESIVNPSNRTWLRKMYKRFHRSILKRPKRPEDFKEHGLYVFEELIRIPFVIAGPGIPKGKVFDQQVSQIDIMSTILDLVQISNPPQTPGRSFCPMIRGESLPEYPVFVESGSGVAISHWHAIRRPPWKYVEHPRNSENIHNDPRLYNIHDDPLERRNVIKQFPEIALELRHELDKLVTSHDASAPTPGQDFSDEDQEKVESTLKALGYM